MRKRKPRLKRSAPIWRKRAGRPSPSATNWLTRTRHAGALRGELGEAHRNAEALGHQLADVNGQLEALRHELTDARSQADALRADLQRETERADAADHDLDAAIEAHGNVDAARMEAEAECRRQAGIASAAQKELADVRALLDASVAQVAKIGMQLDANAAENGTLAADLTAAQAELQSARTQREATTAQLDASRARVQTLERNQAAHEDRVRRLESSLNEATVANDVLRAESAAHSGSDLDVGQALSDAGDLREQVARLGSLLDSSSQAVEELAEKTTITDLFAALVRHLAGEFSRVALFRLKANRLEGEDQIGFDDTTDVTKLVLPLSVDSLITRAASSGTYEQLTGDDLDDNSRAPFGGTPVVAIAMPIAFQGETLAVVYADSDRFTSERGAGLDASIGFARLIVRTAGVLLMRLSQELKMLNELRDYAAMLLQEAQEMYSGRHRGGEERRRAAVAAQGHDRVRASALRAARGARGFGGGDALRRSHRRDARSRRGHVICPRPRRYRRRPRIAFRAATKGRSVLGSAVGGSRLGLARPQLLAASCC